MTAPPSRGAGQVTPAQRRLPPRAQRVGWRGLSAHLLFVHRDEIIDNPALLVAGGMTVPGRVCSGTKCVCENPPAATAAR